MDSLWDKFDMEQRIREVLSDPKFDTTHPFKRPFLTPYQIAIALDERYPNLCAKLGKDFGGKGTGKHNSFVQYIAHRLGTRVQEGKIHEIEGAFLANTYLNELSYRHSEGQPVESSNTSTEHLSIYRLCKPK